jgi:predicted adenylyl cyclase CyaB
MNLEIEAKIKVEQLDLYAHKLRQLDAHLHSTVEQKDCFFDRPDHSLLQADSGLRLRQEIADQQQRNVLCFKGPCRSGKFKQRTEIQFQVDHADQTEMLLEALGFVPTLQFDDCLVCLDVVEQLGNFIEIEGPDEQSIQRVLDKLQLAECDHVPNSYAKMLVDKIGNA